jgi:SOS regulatory protein LexA
MTINLQLFGAYLKELRKKQGLTLRQLSEKTGVSNAYLSQLENGKRGIPKPDILMKIHKPLEVEYEDLMEKAGHISSQVRSELLPETIQAMASYDVLNELLSNAADVFLGSVTDESGLLNDSFKQYLFNASFEDAGNLYSKEDLEKVMDDPNFKQQIFNHLTTGEKISLLNDVIKDFVDRDIDPGDVFKSNSQKISENSIAILRVPVLGFIAAGQPIFAQEHIEEWTEIPNMWNLKEKEAIVLKVKGDSMIGSRIFDGDRVVVKLQQEVENGEIAVVNINGDEATLKRVKKTENGQVILFPDNPNYEPIFVTNEGARIIGKVIQVMFEPK